VFCQICAKVSMSQVRVSRKAGADNIARGEVPPTCFAEVGASNINSIQGRSYSSLELPVSSADASTQSSVFWSYWASTGRPSASPRVISLFIWLPYVWTYLSTSDTEGYLRVRSRANPMHTSEKLSSFTIENAMLDSSKSSIQHYNRTKQCCFAFIYWSKFIPTFEKDG
jgi:hypothetical protein